MLLIYVTMLIYIDTKHIANSTGSRRNSQASLQIKSIYFSILLGR